MKRAMPALFVVIVVVLVSVAYFFSGAAAAGIHLLGISTIYQGTLAFTSLYGISDQRAKAMAAKLIVFVSSAVAVFQMFVI